MSCQWPGKEDMGDKARTVTKEWRSKWLNNQKPPPRNTPCEWFFSKKEDLTVDNEKYSWDLPQGCCLKGICGDVCCSASIVEKEGLPMIFFLRMREYSTREATEHRL